MLLFWLPELPTEMCSGMQLPQHPAGSEDRQLCSALLFSALSLLPCQLQHHQITQGSATDSNADHCPGAWQSLSSACVQHSHLFNYFCSVSLVFPSLKRQQAAVPSPSQAVCSSNDDFHLQLMVGTKAAPRAALTMPFLNDQTHVWLLLTQPHTHTLSCIQPHPHAGMGILFLQPCVQPHDPETAQGLCKAV